MYQNIFFSVTHVSERFIADSTNIFSKRCLTESKAAEQTKQLISSLIKPSFVNVNSKLVNLDTKTLLCLSIEKGH